MIEFNKTKVWNWENAIYGMRAPLESWDKSDTEYGCWLKIGDNDLKLMKNLIKAGSDHRKFMRQIMVSTRITAPDYWWKEYDTYKVGTVANSTSSMHSIMSKPFDESMFSWDKCYLQDYKDMTIANLNYLRARYLESKDKKDWYCLIQMLPMSYNYTRVVTLNYEVVYNMYHARKHHKLDEWSIGFCNWVEQELPYSKELITGEK